MSDRIRIWDLPLRLFHWLLVLSVAAAYLTGEIGGSLADWHGRVGAVVLGLLAFRIVWGFAGSTHARFADFFPTPSRILAYLRGHWHGHGHNPLGGLSVLTLLAVLTLQVVTGLFANDDIAFQGPLFALIDKDLSDRISGWHGWAFDVLIWLIGLHLAAIAFYLVFRGNNLIGPMLTGDKPAKSPAVSNTHVRVSPVLLVISVAVAVFLSWAIHSGWLLGALQPESPPVAQAAPPAW